MSDGDNLIQSNSLEVSALSKCYILFDKPHQRLLSYFISRYEDKGSEFWALRDISFNLRRGETLGIVGRNGSGKSTLLQMVCGTLTPTQGKVQTHGRIAALLELGAGFNPEFTGRENILLNAAIYGLSKEQIAERLDDIIAFADIGDFIDQPVLHYSSGMFVRLAFAVIAHVDADILIIDEALAVGDAMFALKCMRFLEEFKQKGSILFVSHNSAAITSLCDRAMWLDKGKMMLLGDATEVTEAYLEHIYSERQDVTMDTSTERSESVLPADAANFEAWYDARSDLLSNSNLRNDLEIFRFEPEGNAFGTGKVQILDVCLRDQQNRRLSWMVGGTPVIFEVDFMPLEDLDQVIVGFLLNNKMGQVLFGENNYLADIDSPVSVVANGHYKSRIGFTMPYLPEDEYVFSIGIATGSQADHIQHCWRHDALSFVVTGGHVVHGLMGVHTGFCQISKVEP